MNCSSITAGYPQHKPPFRYRPAMIFIFDVYALDIRLRCCRKSSDPVMFQSPSDILRPYRSPSTKTVACIVALKFLGQGALRHSLFIGPHCQFDKHRCCREIGFSYNSEELRHVRSPFNTYRGSAPHKPSSYIPSAV